MNAQPFRQRNRQKTRLYSIAGIACGILLFAAVGAFGWINDVPWAKSLTEGVASTLIVAMTIGLLWDFWGRNDFKQEIFETTKLRQEVLTSGLLRIGSWGELDLDWKDLIRGQSSLDLFFNYAESWRNRNIDLLKSFAGQNKKTINVFLLDPTDEDALTITASRFDGLSADQLRERIISAHAAFSKLKTGRGSSVNIFRHKGVQLYGLYLTSDRAVVTLHKHGLERSTQVPTMVFADGTTIEFFRKEVAEIRNNSVPWTGEE